jgi:hypothetical protein
MIEGNKKRKKKRCGKKERMHGDLEVRESMKGHLRLSKEE